ncbi:MAG: hypothetical protein ACK6DS_16035, partial [Planctomycetota bacterium]
LSRRPWSRLELTRLELTRRLEEGQELRVSASSVVRARFSPSSQPRWQAARPSLAGKLGWESWLGSLVGKGGWDLGVGQWLHVAAESAA